MKWRMLKWAIGVVLIIGALAGGVYWWRINHAIAPDTAQAEQMVEQIERGSIRQSVQCTGRVVSNLDVEIKCRASGQVIKIPFDISDHVKKDDLLLELDPVDQERQVQQAEASLAASKARLAQAKVALLTAEKNIVVDGQKAHAALQSAKARAADASAKAKREEELLVKKYTSPENVETARTTAVQAEQDVQTAQAAIEGLKTQEIDLETDRQQISLSQAQLDSDQIALDLAKRQLGYTKVFAPIDGVISDRQIQIGQIISSGISNVGGGTTALMLSDLSRIYILASVDESDIGEVQLGQTADITADAYPRKQFTGKVDRIAAKGLNTQNVVTFEVRVEVLSEDKLMLKPEMTANVSILVAEATDTLLAPAGAIFRDKGDMFVSLQKPDGTIEEKHPVQVGITDLMQTQILSGLQEGDNVVIQGTEADSRWRAGGANAAQQNTRQRMMMMRTMGGGGGFRR